METLGALYKVLLLLSRMPWRDVGPFGCWNIQGQFVVWKIFLCAIIIIIFHWWFLNYDKMRRWDASDRENKRELPIDNKMTWICAFCEEILLWANRIRLFQFYVLSALAKGSKKGIKNNFPTLNTNIFLYTRIGLFIFLS